MLEAVQEIFTPRDVKMNDTYDVNILQCIFIGTTFARSCDMGFLPLGLSFEACRVYNKESGDDGVCGWFSKASLLSIC